MPQDPKPLSTKDSIVTTPDGEVGVKVLAQDPVTVIATDKATHLEKGRAYVVHRSMAQSFVDKGYATYEDSSDDEKAKQTKKVLEKAKS